MAGKRQSLHFTLRVVISASLVTGHWKTPMADALFFRQHRSLSHCILPGWTFLLKQWREMSIACKHLSVTCFQTGKKVSGRTWVFRGCEARQTTPFLWLWWHAYVLLLKALQEMMRQKPISSGREQLTFGNLTCLLQQRLWWIWYFEGTFVNTDTMQ